MNNITTQQLTVNIPCKIGSYVYKAIADKRVTKPHKLLVIGMWLSMETENNSIHLAHYDADGALDYSNSLLFSAFGDILFNTEEEALARMKELHNGRR